MILTVGFERRDKGFDDKWTVKPEKKMDAWTEVPSPSNPLTSHMPTDGFQLRALPRTALAFHCDFQNQNQVSGSKQKKKQLSGAEKRTKAAKVSLPLIL